jgi:hypothetical protein
MGLRDIIGFQLRFSARQCHRTYDPLLPGLPSSRPLLRDFPTMMPIFDFPKPGLLIPLISLIDRMSQSMISKSSGFSSLAMCRCNS